MEKTAAHQVNFVDEAVRIVREAEKQRVILRMMGATAIRLHCPSFTRLHRDLGREISDIDFVGYNKQTSKISKVFESLNYATRPLSYSFVQAGRLIFTENRTGGHADVFLNRLEMCHTIDYTQRLEIDNPTVPLAELLLQKMQIVQISEKDVIDTIVLLREHEIGDGDTEMVNAAYIAKLLSNDWGFYYTVTTNLQKVKSLVVDFRVLDNQDKQVVTEKIGRTVSLIEAEPKNRSWNARAKVGTKKKWYKDVYSAPK